MLITENLLRRMIQHTLTQKILKEQQSSTNSKPEGDEEGVAENILSDDNQFENKDDTNMNPKQNVIEVRH
jgi:hypothetical protein